MGAISLQTYTPLPKLGLSRPSHWECESELTAMVVRDIVFFITYECYYTWGNW